MPDAAYKPTGQKMDPAWYEKMTVEDLFQVPFSKHIDMKGMKIEEDDWQEIQEKRKKYHEELSKIKK